MPVGEGEFTPPALLPPMVSAFLMSIATDAMSVAFFCLQPVLLLGGKVMKQYVSYTC